ncbi:hypothetical protein PRVXT_001477 [Proteinivorax tanatarense]|uniref:Uncharacterized protein n=1 Tax=Proteinivorax tanatarense TaxID=1260629 RepID=A0AAU7VR85_9FIRM
MKIRWPVAIIVSIICIVVFLVGIRMYDNYTIYTPLEKILDNHSSIEQYEHTKQGEFHTISLTLDNSVDLHEVHEEIDLELSKLLGENFKVIYSRRLPKDDHLFDLYWRVELALEDMAKNGSYLQTIKYLDELFKDEGKYFLKFNRNWLYYGWDVKGYEYNNIVYVGEEGTDGS